MPNIATVLKAEVARVARREIRAQTEALKQSASSIRREIAALKRRVQTLDSELRKRARTAGSGALEEQTSSDVGAQRFSAKGFASLGKLLGLPASEMGRLIGASALSAYKWEQGKASPWAKYLPAVAGIRTIGKRESIRRLQTAQ